MSKKKYLIIIAFVVFVFLAVFTFANPLNNNEEEVNDNRVLEEIEEDDITNKDNEKEEVVEEDKEVIVPIYPVYNNHGVNINNKPQVIDNSYEIALEAVEKAETTFDKETLETASELVDRVKDNSKKEELEERLEEIEEILELIDFVDTLVKDVKQASNKTDMDNIRRNVVANEVLKRLEELTNEKAKESITEKIESIADALEDIAAPEFNIEDGAMLNSDTKVIVTDDSEVTIKLNDEEIENETTVKEEGEYELFAIDASFNSTTVSFVIDRTAPELTIVNPEKYELEIQSEYVEKGYSATDVVSGDITELVEKSYEFKSIDALEYEKVEELDTNKLGTYKITYIVYDKAGNSVKATREVEIVDTTAPEVNVTFGNGVTYITAIDATTVKFNLYKDTTLESEYKEEEIGNVLELDSNELTEGNYIVEVEDIVGNKSTVDVFVASDIKEALTFSDEITLHNDIEYSDENIIITRGQNKVINLNGNKIIGRSTAAAASNLFLIESGSSLKLEGEGEISFTAGSPDTDWGTEGPKPYPGYANNTISNRGKLVIDGPTIKNNTARGGASYVIDNYDGADLKILSGTIEQTGGDIAIRLFAGSATNKNKVTINGGTIIGRRAIWIQLAGPSSSVAPLIDVTINGGTFTSTDDVYYLALYSYSFGNSFAQTNVTINGGTFNGHVAFGAGYYADTEIVTIDGGIFNASVGRYTSTGWIDFPKTW